VADLADPETLDLRLDRLLLHTTRCAGGLGAFRRGPRALRAALDEIAPRLLALRETRLEGPDRGAGRAGRRILFEGAQGALLDIDFGTYPT
jgi:adenylosuccinate synthase